jgi:ParB-like chromosome segregation protein Spo0J
MILKKQTKKQIKKLKESLLENGFSSPFLVWEREGKIYCLDGHQRIPAIKSLEADGEKIPKKLPAVFVDCKDENEAKRAITIFNSHYANIDRDVFNDWMEDVGNEDDLLFLDLFTENDIIEEEIKPYDKYHILISYGNDKLLEVNKLLEEIQKIEGIEVEQSAN